MGDVYVFFDVDGVLNRESDWKKSKFSVNEECVRCFREFVQVLESVYRRKPKLVICSTWRTGMNRSGESYSGAGEILAESGLAIDDSTPVSSKTRQDEIEYYIRRNCVEKYIVIDDDRSLFPRSDSIHLYTPDYHTGLTSKDVKLMKKQFIKQNGH